MKEEQIEKWEEKAKAGMLYHDKTLGKIITEIRSAVTSKVEDISGKYNNIFSIGISTTGLKGELTLDTDKLKAALADDPDAVYNVFAKLDSNDEFSSNGVAQRLGDVFQSAMKSVKAVGGSSASIAEDSELNNLMRELQTKMSNFKRMMQAFENKLYKKYDAMESSLALLGSQLNYVTSAFQ
jgi:flagellar hook-associated protein 2